MDIKKDFWDFVKEANWTLDHDYKRIGKLLVGKYKNQRFEFESIYNFLEATLDEKYIENWLDEPGINCSDDSWGDLLSEVIGRGIDSYNNITVDKLVKMADNRDYTEKFGYCFHYIGKKPVVKYSVEKKDEIEKIFIRMVGNIGMDIPENFEDIVQSIYEDVCETADPINWSDGDVAIGFRRWIESK